LEQYPREVRERFHATPEQLAAGPVGAPPQRWEAIVIEEYDPGWADRFAAAASHLTVVLGRGVRAIEHVGSTSVPGLPAKPIIDIDLILDDTADESRYLPALEGAGYRLVLREPWWYGHRMLVSESADVNLHVWPHDAPEPVRHKLFRDWLRERPDDRDLYATAKRRIAAETVDRPGDYSLAKNDVIDQIYDRIFAESDYWQRLEYRICREFEGFADERLRRFWCDGLDPEEYDLAAAEPCIRGRAWCGPDGQDHWRFTLLVGPEMRSRAGLDWAALLPGAGLTGWLSPYPAEKRMVIDPLGGHPE
jgi:GrpB-like predicted nucleotidyltransferase (UPF0157 family)